MNSTHSGNWSPDPGPQTEALQRREKEILLGGSRGGAKGLPLRFPVLTPFGWKRMGDVKVGDDLCNPDGSVSKCIGVYPLGLRDIYNYTFDDGTVVPVTYDHIWLAHRANKTVKHGGHKVTGDERAKLWTTEQMYSNQNPKKRWLIPVTKPVKFTIAQQNLKCPVDAYLLGVILGDGCASRRNGVRFCGIDPEIADKIRNKYPDGISEYKYPGRSVVNYNFKPLTGVKKYLERWGLIGKKSYEKFIPEQYLYAPEETRWELLRGLMDTDGTADADGGLSFTSTSLELIKGIRHLIQSLGGTVTQRERIPTYSYKGEKLKGMLAYHLYIKFRDPSLVFSLKRKLDRVKPPQFLNRTIVSIIKQDLQEESVCIKVNNPNGLFIVGGFVVTHNTETTIAWLGEPEYIAHPDYRSLILRQNADDLKDFMFRCERFYGSDVATFTKQPPEIRWKAGGVTRCGHWADKDTISKYLGHEYWKIVIEELTQSVGTKNDYDLIMGSCRCSEPGFIAQMMATTNPGGKGHCVRQGEILTDHGWIDIKDARIGDMVASMDDAGKLFFEPVEQVHQSMYSGILKSFNSITMNIEATPEHKIWRRTETKTAKGRTYHDPSSIELSKLSRQTKVVRSSTGWNGTRIDKFILPYVKCRKPKLKQPTELSGDDYCDFMGWYLSEGFVLNRKGKKKDRMFGICQSKPEGVKIIRALLDRCGFEYNYDGDQFKIYSVQWHEYLKQFGKCYVKYVPSIIKNATMDQLNIFLISAILGDGHKKLYFTTSKVLADDMQEIGLKLGLAPAIRSRHRAPSAGVKTRQRCYEITFRLGRDGWLEKKDIKDIEYTGPVYCIGVSNHRFWLRQNGRVFLSGNSWVKDYFVNTCLNKPYKDPATGYTRIFIPSTVDDNPHADPAYVKWLEGLPEPLRSAWRYGSWEQYEGQFFTDFGPHLKVDPFPLSEPQANGSLYGSLDVGTTHDTSFGLWWISPESKIWRLFSYDENGGNHAMHAKAIFDKIEAFPCTHGLFPEIIWYDPSAHTKVKLNDQMTRSIIDEYTDIFRAAGKHTQFMQANNDRRAGCTLMKMVIKGRYGTPEVGYFGGGFNKSLEDGMAAAIADKNDPEVYKKMTGDDEADQTRYGILGCLSVMSTKKQGSTTVREAAKVNRRLAEQMYEDL